MVREAPTDATTSDNTIGVDRVLDMAQEFPHVHFRGIDIGNIALRHWVLLKQTLTKHKLNSSSHRHSTPSAQCDVRDA